MKGTQSRKRRTSAAEQAEYYLCTLSHPQTEYSSGFHGTLATI
ncbi:unnamed protein product [Periconia digitata]|uniref:Uncharacterized protein n=1 Tax=Periconia digitata TaxID=1303443 RepID=A0A9W4UT33_9PLEO|nr:unnamed protein product [Periconia digitata]